MGKIMLICVLLSASMPLMTTEVSTGPETDRGTTPQPTQGKPEAMSDTSKEVHAAMTVPPSAKAMEIVTAFSTTPSKQQNLTIATTISATKDIQTSPNYNKMATSNKDLATTMVEKVKISSTSSGLISTAQTSTMSTEPAKVAIPTETATTRAVPTAKLSATTQFVPSVQNTTKKLATTTKFVSTTIQLTPFVHTTMKLPQTTKNTPPVVVTKGQANTSSKAKMDKDAKQSSRHGKIVAGLIGGALILMMVGFLVILYKRNKLKKHQIATTDWAGPTPFLEAGGDERDNGHVAMRSANKISLTSFLPQRFSKRMSLLAEAEEMQDMQEMAAGTTFVVKDEKNGTEPNQNLETSVKEAKESNSESSEKTEEVVLVDETKVNGETGKEKNGEAAMKDGENGQVQNAASQPAPQEDAPNETKEENKEHTEKDGDTAA